MRAYFVLGFQDDEVIVWFVLTKKRNNSGGLWILERLPLLRKLIRNSSVLFGYVREKFRFSVSLEPDFYVLKCDAHDVLSCGEV